MNQPQVTTKQLVAYVLGELDGRRAGEIESRVGESPALATMLDDVREVVAALEQDETRDAPAGLLREVAALLKRRSRPALRDALREAGRVVAELVYDTRREPALAGFRGAATTSYQLTYVSDAGSVDLLVSPRAGGNGGGWRVCGQLDGTSRLEGAAVALVPTGTDEPVARVETDPTGYFRLLCAAPGLYDVVVALDEGALVLRDVDLR